LLYAPAPPEELVKIQEQYKNEDAGRAIESLFGSLSVDLKTAGVRNFIVAGGETSGKISVRIDDSSILATSTGSCLGRLSADDLSVVDYNGIPLSGPPPSKEVQFHLALYTDPACGSDVHLHSI
jgi:hypothetical protein